MQAILTVLVIVFVADGRFFDYDKEPVYSHPDFKQLPAKVADEFALILDDDSVSLNKEQRDKILEWGEKYNLQELAQKIIEEETQVSAEASAIVENLHEVYDKINATYNVNKTMGQIYDELRKIKEENPLLEKIIFKTKCDVFYRKNELECSFKAPDFLDIPDGRTNEFFHKWEKN
ncbi:hypothetical protein OESDEN_09362 [Oesophagostomum dentatum]|uniref:SXP/RAL-2 family protein Ani s 5-like cation-binding domain-containing protein n=1 Tax=Oesophagostomum dentatum TaxID=61180 RepID=A0A0B1T0N1_OESDE|nr:hypothetical protein OESDEN_09362 [Oesophagostomum dentatum]